MSEVPLYSSSLFVGDKHALPKARKVRKRDFPKAHQVQKPSLNAPSLRSDVMSSTLRKHAFPKAHICMY